MCPPSSSEIFSSRPRTRDNNSISEIVACFSVWSVGYFSTAVRQRSPTPPRGLRHGVICWVVRHRWVVIDPRLSLCRLASLTEIASCVHYATRASLVTVARYFPSRVLMTLSLSVMHAGGLSHVFEFCELVFLLGEAFFESLHVCSCLFLTSLCASWSPGTPRLRNVCTDRPVDTSGGAFSLSLSCFKHFWHRFVGCRSRLLLMNPVFALGYTPPRTTLLVLGGPMPQQSTKTVDKSHTATVSRGCARSLLKPCSTNSNRSIDVVSS